MKCPDDSWRHIKHKWTAEHTLPIRGPESSSLSTVKSVYKIVALWLGISTKTASFCYFDHHIINSPNVKALENSDITLMLSTCQWFNFKTLLNIRMSLWSWPHFVNSIAMIMISTKQPPLVPVRHWELPTGRTAWCHSKNGITGCMSLYFIVHAYVREGCKWACEPSYLYFWQQWQMSCLRKSTWHRKCSHLDNAYIYTTNIPSRYSCVDIDTSV